MEGAAHSYGNPAGSAPQEMRKLQSDTLPAIRLW
jgi:hypothetical protein